MSTAPVCEIKKHECVNKGGSSCVSGSGRCSWRRFLTLQMLSGRWTANGSRACRLFFCLSESTVKLLLLHATEYSEQDRLLMQQAFFFLQPKNCVHNMKHFFKMPSVVTLTYHWRLNWISPLCPLACPDVRSKMLTFFFFLNISCL